jgi:Fe2+ or Zn2+ uptake regulation protein
MRDLDAIATSRLRAVGQRYTSGRQAIVALLDETDRPLSMPDILQADPDLPQSSVYRNLVVLEQAGVVHRIVTNGEFARFELAEDLAGHHHHTICTSCGAVGDFTVPDALERELDSVLRRVARKQGFAAAGHRLDLVGLCTHCSR